MRGIGEQSGAGQRQSSTADAGYGRAIAVQPCQNGRDVRRFVRFPDRAAHDHHDTGAPLYKTVEAGLHMNGQSALRCQLSLLGREIGDVEPVIGRSGAAEQAVFSIGKAGCQDNGDFLHLFILLFSR